MDQPPYDIPLPPRAVPGNEPMPNPNNAPPISTGSTKQQEQVKQKLVKIPYSKVKSWTIFILDS